MIDWDLFLSKFNVELVYNDFIIDDDKSISDQIENLKEDLLQIKIKDNLLLDIGWYPSFSIDGGFQVKLIKNNNWDIPIEQMYTKNINELMKFLREKLHQFNRET